MQCKKIFLLFISAFCVGCAAYRPAPLTDRGLDEAIAAPDKKELAREAARLRHPRIQPVTLDFSKPLTPEELSVVAVLVNPDLKAVRAREGVADAQVFSAGLLPDPQLSAGLDHPISPTRGLVNAYNLALSWNVASLITRPSARRAAEAESEQTRYDVAWQEWMVANKAQLLAERMAYLEKREAVASEASDSALRLLESTRRSLAHGDAKIDELGLREAAYIDARDTALALAREKETARQELNRLLGLPPADPVSITVKPVYDISSLNASDIFAFARRERLDLIALQKGYDAQEERLYGAILGQYPGFSLGFSRASDTSKVNTVGISVSIDIPVFNRNRGAIAVARATRAQLRAEYAARLHQARSDISILEADIENISRERAALKKELPLLRRAAEAMRGAMERGDADLVSYEAVRAALLDKELKLLALEQAASEQRVALQLAAGAPLHIMEKEKTDK